MGLFVSTVLIYIIHFAKAKVNDIYTIEKNSTIPVAIATPFLKGQSAIDDNFLKEAIQIELKGLINKKNIIAISSYDNEKDHLFHSRNLALAFKKQGRKIVIIDATGQLENEFEPTEYLDFSDPKYLSYTKATFQNELEEIMQECELCIIHNQSIKKDKLALLFMSLATTNLIVLDSRKSAEKNILKIELLKDEYKLPDVWFVLNKSGYNPSVLGEVKKIWLKYIKK
jgi:hypothetical protein